VTGASSGSGSASIVETADDLAAAVAEALAHGPGVAEPYAARIRAAFPDPSTPAWPRVVEAIRERSRLSADSSG
jgi:hypothetical protein